MRLLPLLFLPCLLVAADQEMPNLEASASETAYSMRLADRRTGMTEGRRVVDSDNLAPLSVLLEREVELAREDSARSAPETPVLFPRNPGNDSWGYVDSSGRMVIAPRFRRAYGFSEGLAFVWLFGDSTGYINTRGEVVIGPTHKWDRGTAFSEGRAVVWLHSREARERIWRFEEGCFSSIRKGPAQYTTKSGRYITDRWYTECYQFEAGMGVCIGPGTTCIDRDGKVLFRLEQIIEPYSEGLAAVRVRDSVKGILRGYVDRQGDFAIPPREGIIGRPFNEGLAEALWWSDTLSPPRAGYIDKAGEMVLQTPYRIGPYSRFSEGLAVVYADEGGEWHGCIDTTGRLVFKVKGEVRRFHEGLAVFRSEGKYGYLDRTGRIVIEPRFGEAWDFRRGFAKVELREGSESREFYIDKLGEEQDPPPYY
jgi:hypothetical protein